MTLLGFNGSVVDCGAVVDGSIVGAGVLTSPGYPEQYQQDLYCVWTILVSYNTTAMLVITCNLLKKNGENMAHLRLSRVSSHFSFSVEI